MIAALHAGRRGADAVPPRAATPRDAAAAGAGWPRFLAAADGAAPVLRRKAACNCGGDCPDCAAPRLPSQGESNEHAAALQRRCDDCAGEASGAAVPPAVAAALAGAGRPLDDPLRSELGQRFGHDFGAVRIHDDAAAAASARAVDAQAYTVGHDVVFAEGRFAPAGAAGRRLLAHELAHVVQQSAAGAGLAKAGPLAVGAVDDPAERAADRAADAVLAGNAPVDVGASGAAALRRACGNERKGIGADVGTPECVSGGKAFVAGPKLKFCTDTDELLPGQDKLEQSMVGLAKGASTLELHGHASLEGPSPEYNANLSCHRSNAVRERFKQAGVTALQTVIAHGATRVYGDDLENRNVVLVITSTKPPQPADEGGGGGTPPPKLPNPAYPEQPPGPVVPKGAPGLFCQPLAKTIDLPLIYLSTRAAMLAFASGFGADVEELWRTYLDTPKVGTKGTLPPRKVFSQQDSRVVKAFRDDPATQAQKSTLMQQIADAVRANPKFLPAIGQTGPFFALTDLLTGGANLDLPIAYQDPWNRIPGLIAGGFGKDASDAGDDVRNVDGRVRITNLDGSLLNVGVALVFDVLDCVDFCPGAPGSTLAQGITIPLSRLEATPDIPTYDTPFEVIFSLNDSGSF